MFGSGTKSGFKHLPGMIMTTQNRDSGYRELANGTWYIAMTDLPLWRKRSGVVSYQSLPDGNLADVICWRQGRRAGHIVGIDRPITDDGWQWEWRGVEPLTLFARSRWKFLSGSIQQGWAVTQFEKTLFTPAGIDIYCRSPRPAHGQLSAALASLPEEVARRLFLPPLWTEAQDPRGAGMMAPPGATPLSD